MSSYLFGIRYDKRLGFWCKKIQSYTKVIDREIQFYKVSEGDTILGGLVAERVFPLETVLSCIGVYKIKSGIPMIASTNDLTHLLSFMSGEYPVTFLTNPRILVVTASICGLVLTQQHPALGEVTAPFTTRTIPRQEVEAWLETLYPTFGSEVTVRSLGEDFALNDIERQTITRDHRKFLENLAIYKLRGGK